MTIDFNERLRKKREQEDLEAREAAALAELVDREHKFYTSGKFDPWHPDFDEKPEFGHKWFVPQK